MTAQRKELEWRSDNWLNWYRDALIAENEGAGPVCDRIITALGDSRAVSDPYRATRRKRLSDPQKQMRKNVSVIRDISEILALRGAD